MGQLKPDTEVTSYASTAHCISRTAIILWYCVIVMTSSCLLVEGRTFPLDAETVGHLQKRSATADLGVADYPDYQSGIRYDEYPVVVPKRTALLIDKVMVALQKAMGEEKKPAVTAMSDMSDKMDLQRRGQPKGRVYWRCYFNAVTCFKRK